MAYLKGKATIIKVKQEGGTSIPLLAETSSTLSRELETTEVYSKLDEAKQTYGTYHNWSISCEGLFQLEETGFAQVESAFMDAEPVEVEIVVGTQKYTGEVLITSMELSMGQDDMITCSLEGTGVGQLEISEVQA